MPTPDLSCVVWRKSSYSSGNDNCVEVATSNRCTAIRDSKDPYGPALVFDANDFAAFVATLSR